MFHHVGEIDFVHSGHAAARVAAAEITLQQIELLAGRPWAAFGNHEILVAAHVAALRARRFELLRHHPNRDAGLAIEATRPVGDGLAAAEADPPERVVERLGMRALELGEHLALGPARKVRARRRAGDEEAWKPNRGRHVAGGPLTKRVTRQAMQRD